MQKSYVDTLPSPHKEVLSSPHPPKRILDASLIIRDVLVTKALKDKFSKFGLFEVIRNCDKQLAKTFISRRSQ